MRGEVEALARSHVSGIRRGRGWLVFWVLVGRRYCGVTRWAGSCHVVAIAAAAASGTVDFHSIHHTLGSFSVWLMGLMADGLMIVDPTYSGEGMGLLNSLVSEAYLLYVMS